MIELNPNSLGCFLDSPRLTPASQACCPLFLKCSDMHRVGFFRFLLKCHLPGLACHPIQSHLQFHPLGSKALHTLSEPQRECVLELGALEFGGAVGQEGGIWVLISGGLVIGKAVCSVRTRVVGTPSLASPASHTVGVERRSSHFSRRVWQPEHPDQLREHSTGWKEERLPISLQTPDSLPLWDPVMCGLLLCIDGEHQGRSFLKLPSRRNWA